MKKLYAPTTLLKLLLIFLVFSNYNASAQKTTIYIVRHAEKEANPPADPELSKAGQKRAYDLLTSLKKEKIAAVYVTDYKRTKSTGKPVAEKFGLTPELYNPLDLTAFVAKVLEKYKGQTVLIVGHSNTVLPTVKAFSNERPFGDLTDEDYDMLFKLTIKGDKTEIAISYYGDPHHTTQIPDQYLGYTKEHFIKPPGRF